MNTEGNLRDCGQSYVEGGKERCELNNIHFNQIIVHDATTAAVFNVNTFWLLVPSWVSIIL